MNNDMIHYSQLRQMNLENYLRDVLTNAQGNVAIRLHCDNHYGASIIRHAFSYGGSEGLFELAVLKFQTDNKFHLDYTTPITNDVLGYLSIEDVVKAVSEINNLPIDKQFSSW